MDTKSISEIIQDRKLSLSFWDKFDHYSLGYVLLIFSGGSIFLFFDNNYSLFFLIVALILLIPALIVLFYQGKKQLQLREIKTRLDSIEKNHDFVIQTFKELGWEILEDNSRYISAFRKWYKYFSLGKGQIIKVFIDKNSIYVISLFYPTTQAMVIDIRNDDNVRIFGNTFVKLLKIDK
ncbi:MAG: hypothetical protein JW702_07940 [Clostridiales bacterium]|nr:hypothetical protein [Clostridiales bacterium]